MGLDMYLNARKHFHQVDFRKSTSEEYAINEDFTDLMTMTKLSEVQSDLYGASVEVVCAYWRKANAIHGWFVSNVQDGKDDCKEYYVSKEQLQQLRELCLRSDNEKNPSLLMPMEGFFFGSNDVDEYYWSQMKETVVQLDRILALPEVDDLSFYYQSSW